MEEAKELWKASMKQGPHLINIQMSNIAAFGKRNILMLLIGLRRTGLSEIVSKRNCCRNNLSTVSTERMTDSCEHKRYFFVPLANQASQVSKQ